MTALHWLLALVLSAELSADPTALALIRHLTEGDAAAAIEARDELVRLGPPAVVPLFELVGGDDAKVAQGTHQALRWIAWRWSDTRERRGAVCGPLLEVASSNRPAPVRCLALDLLSVCGDERAVPPVAKLLRDAEVADAARRALQAIPGPQATKALTEALRSAPAELKPAVLNALGARQDVSALKQIAACLSARNEPVRVAAAEALGDIRVRGALPALTRALADRSGAVRRAAFDARLQIADELYHRDDHDGARSLLLEALDRAEDDAQVLGALAGLAWLPPRSATDVVAPLLKHTDRRVQAEAAWVLAAIASEEATRALAQALPSASPQVQVTILHALGLRGDPLALTQVAPLASSPDPTMAAEALQALAAMATPEAAPIIKDALTAEAPEVASAAAWAYLNLATLLARGGDTETPRRIWEDLVPRPVDEAILTAALDGLAAIGSLDSLPVLATALGTANGERQARLFDTYVAIAAAVAKRGDTARAAAAYRDALQWVPKLSLDIGPEFGEAFRRHLAVADGLAATGAADEARERYRAALDVAPADSRLADVVGKLIALGEPLDLMAVQGFVRDWWIIGPFPNDDSSAFNRDFFPEHEIELTKPYNSEGIPLAWQKATAGPILDLMGPFAAQGTNNKACYCYAAVAVTAQQDAVLKIGSDDGVVCWLNGEKVHANLVDRGCTVDQDVVRCRVRAGVNTILLKILNNGGGWNACLRLCDAQNRPLRFTSAPPAAPQ